MQRMLIVDDEPVIVDGLYELFEHEAYRSFDLELYRAYNAAGALAIARQLRIDILLTDIEMPRMNGIELAAELTRQWPKCKTIYLTGYNHFSYIHSSIRGGALDYVLKTEGDEPIVAAVAKAVEQLDAELQADRLLSQARTQFAAALPTLRKDYLSDLLIGEPSTPASRSAAFEELSIPLRADRPVYMIVGRVDQWREDSRFGDKALFLYSINNIGEEVLAQTFHTVHMIEDRERFLWLIQPKSDEPGGPLSASAEPLSPLLSMHPYIMGLVELIQTSCRQYLLLSCSFVVASEPCDWEQLPGKYERLGLLFVRGLGLDREMLLTDRRLFEQAPQEGRSRTKRIQLLEPYLEQKDRANFFHLYDDIMCGVEPGIQSGLTLEIHHWLGAVFISYLNRHDLLDSFAETINLSKLFTIREHASWSEVTAFFRELAELIFEQKQTENIYESDEIVRRVHEYVAANLEKDLSLNRLADLVYLAPFYFSRLYKQKTGKSITDHIAELRIQRAKQLLSDPQLKIAEIGTRLGYHSPPYFTRFFKKATQLTPQEYRDAIKG